MITYKVKTPETRDSVLEPKEVKISQQIVIARKGDTGLVLSRVGESYIFAWMNPKTGENNWVTFAGTIAAIKYALHENYEVTAINIQDEAI